MSPVRQSKPLTAALLIGFTLLVAVLIILILVVLVAGCAAPKDADLVDLTQRLDPFDPAVDSTDLPPDWEWCVFLNEDRHGIGMFHVKPLQIPDVIQLVRWKDNHTLVTLSNVKALQIRQSVERFLTSPMPLGMLGDGEVWYLGIDMPEGPRRADLLAAE